MTSILVAEDEDRLASLIVRALSRAGFLVERVSTGTAALDAALSGKYQLLLLDIGLPELDGISVLERIRRLDGSLPILLVTADNAPQHIVLVRQRGSWLVTHDAAWTMLDNFWYNAGRRYRPPVMGGI